MSGRGRGRGGRGGWGWGRGGGFNTFASQVPFDLFPEVPIFIPQILHSLFHFQITL